ncbi:MAG TPA: exosortase, partial [Longimicrobiales bacterium]|nr:exosortase [Longimicrobiales bacterium]
SYQEHGFFVGGLVLWLLWRDRRRIVAAAGEGIPDLLPVVGLLSVGWLLAVIMNVRLVHQLLFWALATTAALAIFGWRARRPILVTAATFLLAIPFWSVFTPVLQRMTTIMSGAIAKAGGVEAVIREDTISISSGTFLVESGCSGINYLMGGLVLGAFYAHLFTNRWQTQAKIVAVAGAMSIVGNWIRVAVLVFLGEATAMRSPYIADHLWQGWAIFTLLMIPTYFIARQIEERDATRAHEGEEAGEGGDGVAEGGEPSPPGTPVLRRRALRTAGVAVVGPALLYVVGALPTGTEVDRDPAIFGFESEWAVAERDAPAEAWAPDFHGYDGRALWSVRGPEGTVHAA